MSATTRRPSRPARQATLGAVLAVLGLGVMALADLVVRAIA